MNEIEEAEVEWNPLYPSLNENWELNSQKEKADPVLANTYYLLFCAEQTIRMGDAMIVLEQDPDDEYFKMLKRSAVKRMQFYSKMLAQLGLTVKAMNETRKVPFWTYTPTSGYKPETFDYGPTGFVRSA